MIRAATRGSPLARWQTDHVVALLAAAEAGALGGGGPAAEALVVSTEGDRRTDVPLSEIGGKGVFVKEVQAAVLAGRAEVAVHSAKDLPAVTPDGLVIAAVLERADPRDALVGARLVDLPHGATVATGSRRRRAQLLALRSDLEVVDLRGNIATRLARLDPEPAGDSGDRPAIDALVMAAAALHRLGLDHRADELFDPVEFVPQVGQGVIAVECRADDDVTRAALAHLDHASTRRLLTVERGFLAELGGDCDLPAGAHAHLDAGRVVVDGVLEVDDELRRARVEAAATALMGDEPACIELGASLARVLREP